MRKKEFDNYTVHKHKEFVFNLENTKFTHVLDIISETEAKTPKPSSKLHSHPYYELYYVIDDDFYMNIEDKINIFHKDDIICVSPFVNHYALPSQNNVEKPLVINFTFEKNELKTNHDLHKKIMKLFSGPYLHLTSCSMLYPTIYKFALPSEDAIKASLFEHSVNFSIIILNLIMLSSKSNNIYSPNLEKNPFSSESNISRLTTISNIINKHFTTGITLQNIADTLNMSTKQISRIIHKEYGCTFYRLIINLRINQATKMLVSTNLSVTEISHQVGYDSTSNFYKAFKKIHNCMPLEYREKMQENNK